MALKDDRLSIKNLLRLLPYNSGAWIFYNYLTN